MNKKTLYLFLVSINIVIILFLIVSAINSFLTFTDNKDNESEVGLVDVDIKVYFVYKDEEGQPKEYKGDINYSVTTSEGLFTKLGVVKVNISEVDDPQFIKNLRVDINVKSTVDTYFRVAPYEQLTYTYVLRGITREVASTQRYFMEFNYDPLGEFENRRIFDGFYYYKEKVKRISKDVPYVIALIDVFDDEIDLKIYDQKYSLQIGFMVEAVQAHLGPQKSWGLNEPPWEGGVW